MSARILYIEDNEQNFYLVSFILRLRGHEVEWARDGQSGLDAVASQRFDLILLDIQLPVLDGHGVATALRARQDTREVPIVALTSYAMAGDRERALDSGCNEYIEKPIDPTRFAAQVEALLVRNAAQEGRP